LRVRSREPGERKQCKSGRVLFHIRAFLAIESYNAGNRAAPRVRTVSPYSSKITRASGLRARLAR
jgi:hypothetical protein